MPLYRNSISDVFRIHNVFITFGHLFYATLGFTDGVSIRA
jgi:hypothetical protein